jgi:hypothetical protein
MTKSRIQVINNNRQRKSKMGNFTWKSRQTAAGDAPQLTKILPGRNLKVSLIQYQSQQLVEEIMKSQEKKDPSLSEKQRRLLAILKKNQDMAGGSDTN